MTHGIRSLVLGVSAALAYVAVSVTVMPLYTINTSPSLPIGLYRVVSEARPGIGDLVLVCLPLNVAAFARARGYLVRGRCASGAEPLGKRIAAAAGDTVAVTSAGLVINGCAIPSTAPLQFDSRGRALPRLTGYRRVLQVGELWLVAAGHPRSFDSRYFGAVSSRLVINVVHPVLTW